MFGSDFFGVIFYTYLVWLLKVQGDFELMFFFF